MLFDAHLITERAPDHSGALNTSARALLDNVAAVGLAPRSP